MMNLQRPPCSSLAVKEDFGLWLLVNTISRTYHFWNWNVVQLYFCQQIYHTSLLVILIFPNWNSVPININSLFLTSRNLWQPLFTPLSCSTNFFLTENRTVIVLQKWLTFFSIKPPESICVVANAQHAWLKDWLIFHDGNVTDFLYSSIDAYLGCFYFMTIFCKLRHLALGIQLSLEALISGTQESFEDVMNIKL